MQIKKYAVLVVAMLPFFTGTGFKSSPDKKETSLATFEDNWTGVISYTHTVIDTRATGGEIKTEFDLLRQTDIIIDVTGYRKAHATISHSMKQREKIDGPFGGGERFIQISETKEFSLNEGDVDILVEQDDDDKKYSLTTNGPLHDVDVTSSFWTNQGGYTAGPPKTRRDHRNGISISIPEQRFGENSNLISGSYVILSSPTIYVAVSWMLVKAKKTGGIKTNAGNTSIGNTTIAAGTNKINAELVVTPENYETWKPLAGDNAPSPGNKEKIELLLRNNGTQPLKAVSFEVKLFSTSRKGSIAADNTDPQDIRFLPQPNAFISDDGQFIKIPCGDGVNGDVTIGSYHNMASTILVAEAVLNNGRRIRGVLLRGGIYEIPIPKTQTL